MNALTLFIYGLECHINISSTTAFKRLKWHSSYVNNIIFAIFIIFPSDSLSFEYSVVKGDTLWEIARTHLGDAQLWPSLIYQNGEQPEPRKLIPGRIITDWGAEKEITRRYTASEAISKKTNHSDDLKKNTKTSSSSSVTNYSFSTSLYCCAQKKIQMNQYGRFEMIQEDHIFVQPVIKISTQPMKSFMNISISQELIDVVKEH